MAVVGSMEWLAAREAEVQRIQDGAVVPDEVPVEHGPVQQRVDAVIDDLRRGLTTERQEATLGRALSDRRVQRVFQR